MDDPIVTSGQSSVPVINLQPLLDKIIEVADVQTLILLLVIFILIGIVISERSRNNTLVKNYMSQSIEIVKVLTTVQGNMTGHQDSVQAIEAVLHKVALSLQEIQVHLRLRKRPSVLEVSPEQKGEPREVD